MVLAKSIQLLPQRSYPRKKYIIVIREKISIEWYQMNPVFETWNEYNGYILISQIIQLLTHTLHYKLYLYDGVAPRSRWASKGDIALNNHKNIPGSPSLVWYCTKVVDWSCRGSIHSIQTPTHSSQKGMLSTILFVLTMGEITLSSIHQQQTERKERTRKHTRKRTGPRYGCSVTWPINTWQRPVSVFLAHQIKPNQTKVSSLLLSLHSVHRYTYFAHQTPHQMPDYGSQTLGERWVEHVFSDSNTGECVISWLFLCSDCVENGQLGVLDSFGDLGGTWVELTATGGPRIVIK